MNGVTTPENQSAPKQPCDLAAEVALLGGLLINNEYVDRVADKITAGDFYNPKHGPVYTAIVSLVSENSPADIVTVADRLKRDGHLDKLGGSGFVIGLTDDVYSAASSEQYAKIIHEKSLLRKLSKLGQQVYSKACAQQDEADDILQYIDSSTLKLSNLHHRADAQAMTEMGVNFITGLDELMDSHEHPEVMKTWVRFGLTDLDRILFRLERDKVGLLAGRPGEGKTTLALQLCRRMSDNGVSSAFFLTEDPAQAFQTMLCWETGIPHWNIRTGDLSDHQYRQVIESVSRLQDGLIHFENIVDNPTPHEVKRRATQLVKQHNIGLIVVDYVQLMEVVGKGYDNANARLSEISRQLSLMAGQLHVPVVVCSQLSRDSVKNQRAPELYDLRDSGSLEQDARWVIMLWHPYKVFIDDKGKITYPPDEAHIYVRKQNSGPTGMAKTYWHENMVRFENITQPWRTQA